MSMPACPPPRYLMHHHFRLGDLDLLGLRLLLERLELGDFPAQSLNLLLLLAQGGGQVLLGLREGLGLLLVRLDRLLALGQQRLQPLDFF